MRNGNNNLFSTHDINVFYIKFCVLMFSFCLALNNLLKVYNNLFLDKYTYLIKKPNTCITFLPNSNHYTCTCNFFIWGVQLRSGHVSSDNFWSAFCVFHAHFWGKTHSFKICALKKCNDFRQLKRSNFRVEKCKTEENLSKILNNMAYKTVTSIRDCVMKRKFM